MAREEATDKSHAELVERAWKVAHKTRVAILIALEDGRLAARPMSSTTDLDAHCIFFLISARSPNGMHDDDPVTVFFNEGNSYVSMRGRARISNDRAKIKQLWTPFAKAWWESAEDPDIRVLAVDPSEGEIWDGPNKLFAGALMLTAAVTGAKPKVGDHGKLRL